MDDPLIKIDLKIKLQVGEKIEKTDKDKSGGGTTKKTTKKGDRLDDAAGGNKKAVSVLDEAAMENAYNICHNVQDLLYFRGFFWEGSGGKGKKVNYVSCQIVSKITFMLDKF